MRITPADAWGWQRFAMDLAGGEHWYHAMFESGLMTWNAWERS